MHQHARCICGQVSSAAVFGWSENTAPAARERISEQACSTQRIGLAPIVLPEGADRLPALRTRSDLVVAVERIELSRARVWAAAVPSTDRNGAGRRVCSAVVEASDRRT